MKPKRSHLEELFVRIHEVIRAIPRGRVATYGQVAELAGLPGGARVAAASLKGDNMRGKGVPWQRVVGKSGPTRGKIKILDPVGAATQRMILNKEGVPVDDSDVVDLRVYGWLPSQDSGQGRPSKSVRTRKKR